MITSWPTKFFLPWIGNVNFLNEKQSNLVILMLKCERIIPRLLEDDSVQTRIFVCKTYKRLFESFKRDFPPHYLITISSGLFHNYECLDIKVKIILHFFSIAETIGRCWWWGTARGTPFLAPVGGLSSTKCRKNVSWAWDPFSISLHNSAYPYGWSESKHKSCCDG